MPHIIHKPGILGGTTLAVFITLVHTMNERDGVQHDGPMVAWMRHRGHDWAICFEMAVAMVAPAIPLCVLRMADVISGDV